MSLALIPCLATYLCECACCIGTQCFCNLIETSLANAVRFAHALILFITIGLAALLGTTFVNNMKSMNGYTSIFGYGYELEKNCIDETTSVVSDECMFSQLIYRSTLSLFILFIALATLSICFEYLNKSFWVVKLGSTIGLFVSFWWTSNDVFDNWAEATKYISFLWLLAQGIIFLDFSYDVHEVIIRRAEESSSSWWYVVYLALCCGLLIGIGILISNMYHDYSGCGPTSTWFITITLIMGIVTTGISLLNSVNKGLLTPCIMFLYSSLMCWDALLSIPSSYCDENSNSIRAGDSTAMPVMLFITCTIVVYCVLNGSIILNVFNPDAEEGIVASYTRAQFPTDSGTVQLNAISSPKASLIDRDSREGVDGDSGCWDAGGNTINMTPSGTRHERVFFMGLMALTSCYIGMILTNWGSIAAVEGNDQQNIGISMWLKVVSQWVMICLHCRVLQVAYQSSET